MYSPNYCLPTTRNTFKERTPKVNPKLGLNGCYGRGCNGCLMFRNDPAYAKARELMAGKNRVIAR